MYDIDSVCKGKNWINVIIGFQRQMNRERI